MHPEVLVLIQGAQLSAAPDGLQMRPVVMWSQLTDSIKIQRAATQRDHLSTQLSMHSRHDSRPVIQKEGLLQKNIRHPKVYLCKIH